MRVSGQLRKMTHENNTPVEYFLSLDEKPVALTPWIGKTVSLTFLGTITCIECGRKIKKSYNQGYCFPCARDLPENALCSVRPEKCEHEHGNEQDREFFRKYCNVDHFVYLSLTAGVKVGITRHCNVPDRWIDQGAVRALVILRVPQRKISGQIEVAISRHISDKTNWRKMLKGEVEDIDLEKVREQVLQWVPENLRQFGLQDEPVQNITYPVQSVPEKITSHNLDKEARFTDTLVGIKGQYLIFAHRVINMRKYAGYHVEFAVES